MRILLIGIAYTLYAHIENDFSRQVGLTILGVHEPSEGPRDPSWGCEPALGSPGCSKCRCCRCQSLELFCLVSYMHLQKPMDHLVFSIECLFIPAIHSACNAN